MSKRYTLPAVTAEGQDTSVGVLVDDEAKLREWLLQVRSCIAVQSFRFNWDTNPRSTVPILLGMFCVLWYQDGIYIKMTLCHEDYRDVEYPLDDFYRMLFKSARPEFGWCITVTVQ